ncbi:MAG: DNRLRE domain-containing protein, partial [Flammeovirgaceae bacterium]
MNWSTSPAAGTLLTSASISGKGKYYSWDVTKHIKDSLAKGGTVFCFLLKDIATNSKDVIFSSRESSSNKPQLVIAAATVPATPGTLSASATSSSQINLTWTDNATNETGYKVE